MQSFLRDVLLNVFLTGIILLVGLLRAWSENFVIEVVFGNKIFGERMQIFIACFEFF